MKDAIQESGHVHAVTLGPDTERKKRVGSSVKRGSRGISRLYSGPDKLWFCPRLLRSLLYMMTGREGLPV